jgi:hypothetical protein
MRPDAAAGDIAKQTITPRHRQDRQSEDPCAEAAHPNLHVMSKGRAYELERIFMYSSACSSGTGFLADHGPAWHLGALNADYELL